MVPTEDPFAKPESIYGSVSKFTSKKEYRYNIRAMCVLLETKYLETKILTQTRPYLYPKFLNRLIDTSNSLQLKTSVCRHIILSQVESKKAGLSEHQKEAYRSLVSPLLSLYRENNYTLAALASAALVNLAAQGRDTKLKIMEEGGDKICVK